MKKKIKWLVTGGAGFLGSEFVRQCAENGDQLAVMDKLTYAGDRHRLDEVKSFTVFYHADICQRGELRKIIRHCQPEGIIHFAAETHVDRSLINPAPFWETNLNGTRYIVEAVEQYKIKRFVHISTDEVYGETLKGKASEDSPLKPGNPYAASKAAADLMILAAVRSFHLPAIIIRPCNHYGPWQYPEKFIPAVIHHALSGKAVPVYGRGKQSREWLFIKEGIQAVRMIALKGNPGQIYNLSSGCAVRNLILARRILKAIGKKTTNVRFVKDRMGHDFRYAMTCRPLQSLGWAPEWSLSQGIKETVQWYIANQKWTQSKTKALKELWSKVYVSP